MLFGVSSQMATPTAEQKPDNSAEKQAKPGEEVTAPPQDEQKKTAKKTELAILNFVIKYLKLVGGALLIWFMGWLGLSYVWLICGFFIYVLWRMNQDERKTRRDAFREATEREHEVVEARMEDLPSWVRSVLCHFGKLNDFVRVDPKLCRLLLLIEEQLCEELEFHKTNIVSLSLNLGLGFYFKCFPL